MIVDGVSAMGIVRVVVNVVRIVVDLDPVSIPERVDDELSLSRGEELFGVLGR